MHARPWGPVLPGAAGWRLGGRAAYAERSLSAPPPGSVHRWGKGHHFPLLFERLSVSQTLRGVFRRVFWALPALPLLFYSLAFLPTQKHCWVSKKALFSSVLQIFVCLFVFFWIRFWCFCVERRLKVLFVQIYSACTNT